MAQVNASLEPSTSWNESALTNQSKQFDESLSRTIREFLILMNRVSYVGNFTVDSIAIGTKAAIVETKNEFFAWIKEQQAEMAKGIGTAKYSEIFAVEPNKYRNNANW